MSATSATKALCAVLALAACGKDLHHTADAGPPDVSIDTIGPSTGDAPAGAVQLKISRGTGPVVGAAVIFQDPSSQVIDEKLTGENGVAWALMPDGGFVTAVEHTGDGVDELTTFAAVKADDKLVLAYADPGQRKEWPLKLTFQPDGGAAHYSVQTSCSSDQFSVDNPQPAATDPPNAITLSGCDDGIADFAITANDVNGDPIGKVLYAEGVALPAPPTAQVDSAAEFPELALVPAFDTVTTHSVSYTNVPTMFASVGVYQGVNATRRSFDSTAAIDVTGSSIAGQLAKPFPTNGASTMLTVSTGYPTVTYDSDGVPHSDSFSQYLFFDWGLMTDTYALNVAGTYVPTYKSSPVYDVGTRSIAWTESTAPLAADLVRAHIHVFRDDVPAGHSWGWRIIAPYAAASVTFPQLPVLPFDFTPSATDTTAVDEVTTAKVPGGYDAWRAQGFADFARAVTGLSGKISVQMLFFPSL